MEDLKYTYFGDVRLNRAVEFADFRQLADFFGSEGDRSAYDFNGNGVVVFTDFFTLSINFGTSTSVVVCEWSVWGYLAGFGVDIGSKTQQSYTESIKKAATVVWNGPMGVFEILPFSSGTLAVATAVAASTGTTVVGGGDSVSAVGQMGVADQITHISTGGGASLEFLGGTTLPGVAVIPNT